MPVAVPPPPTAEELAERDHQNRETARQEVVHELDSLVGHDNVKRQLHGVQTWVQICRRHGRDPKNEWYNIAFLGNPGTGKTTVARIYAKMLYAMGICDSHTVCETTGADLASRGPNGVQQLLRNMTDAKAPVQTAGVLIIDHPHTLIEAPPTPATEQALEDIRHAMERNIGRIIVVFTGDADEITGFLRESPALQQRICSSLRFHDFDRQHLVQLLARRIVTDYNGRMQVEGGLEGTYIQAAARRLVRGRAAKGFTNAHAVREMVKSIAQRQALCLTDQQDSGMDEVDYFFFSKDDVLGPSPAEIKSESAPLEALQTLIGQDAVKASVAEVFDTAEENYYREIRNQRRLPLRINRIFAGPPGTGKSTAIRLYAQILVDLGLLSGGEGKSAAGSCLFDILTPLVRVKPLSALCDLSDEQLRETVESTTGHVLVVDVDTDRQERPTVPDAVVDMLAAARDNHCTILVGTHDTISQFLHRAGSKARGFETHLVRFSPLTRDHMEELFQSKLDEQDLDVTPEAFQAAMDTLDNARMRKDFDNARAVDHLLAAAVYHFERRSRTGPNAEPVERLLEGRDFNPELVGGTTALVFREELRHSIVPDDIISILKRYHNEMKAAWMQGLDPGARMPGAFVFKGGPGTLLARFVLSTANDRRDREEDRRPPAGHPVLQDGRPERWGDGDVLGRRPPRTVCLLDVGAVALAIGAGPRQSALHRRRAPPGGERVDHAGRGRAHVPPAQVRRRDGGDSGRAGPGNGPAPGQSPPLVGHVPGGDCLPEPDAAGMPPTAGPQVDGAAPAGPTPVPDGPAHAQPSGIHAGHPNPVHVPLLEQRAGRGGAGAMDGGGLCAGSAAGRQRQYLTGDAADGGAGDELHGATVQSEA